MATLTDPLVSRRTADFASQKHSLYIDGRFVQAASGKTFPVYNPSTGEVIAHVPEAEEEDVNRAVLAARRAFDDGAWTRLAPQRAASCCGGWRICWNKNLEEFAEIESLDNGKAVRGGARGRCAVGRGHVPLHEGMGDEDPERRYHFRPGKTFTRSRCASRLGWWRRSFRGTFRC